MCRGAYASIAGFLVFSMIQFRDGPFIRPHPVFWRVVLGVNLLYELALVFLLFQDLNSARSMMTYLDPNLGRPLPEKSYAENCALTRQNVWVTVSSPRLCILSLTHRAQDAIDIFCLAHALGWFGKALILRDYWFCWVNFQFITDFNYLVLPERIEILSIAFELAEYSLQHQLPNFAEVSLFHSSVYDATKLGRSQCWWDHVRIFPCFSTRRS